jgi:hypothetical protein
LKEMENSSGDESSGDEWTLQDAEELRICQLRIGWLYGDIDDLKAKVHEAARQRIEGNPEIPDQSDERERKRVRLEKKIARESERQGKLLARRRRNTEAQRLQRSTGSISEASIYVPRGRGSPDRDRPIVREVSRSPSPPSRRPSPPSRSPSPPSRRIRRTSDAPSPRLSPQSPRIERRSFDSLSRRRSPPARIIERRVIDTPSPYGSDADSSSSEYAGSEFTDIYDTLDTSLLDQPDRASIYKKLEKQGLVKHIDIKHQWGGASAVGDDARPDRPEWTNPKWELPDHSVTRLLVAYSCQYSLNKTGEGKITITSQDHPPREPDISTGPTANTPIQFRWL